MAFLSESDEERAIQLLTLCIGGGIASFFAAFLIDVFTDMRHYLQSGNSTLAEMNSKLTGLAAGQLKIDVAEARAAAKLATEKRLEWTGKAMQRAGFKEETLKRALTQGGTVVAWGWNENRQTRVPAGLSGVVALAAGVAHTVALKQDGTVAAWGYNKEGQTTVPAGLSRVVAIAAGGAHTVVLRLE